MLHVAHNRVHAQRVGVLAAHVADLLPKNATVLDVGAGDGLIAKLVMERRTDVTIRGVDVMSRATSYIPVQLFDGTHLPFRDREFDAAMMVDVLHHAEHQEDLLREMVRVVKRAVVIKDHTVRGALARPTLAFMDWVGNARFGVSLPYAYWDDARWIRAFADLDLRTVERRERLGLYPWPASLVFERGLHFVARLDKRS